MTRMGSGSRWIRGQTGTHEAPWHAASGLGGGMNMFSREDMENMDREEMMESMGGYGGGYGDDYDDMPPGDGDTEF